MDQAWPIASIHFKIPGGMTWLGDTLAPLFFTLRPGCKLCLGLTDTRLLLLPRQLQDKVSLTEYCIAGSRVGLLEDGWFRFHSLITASRSWTRKKI